MLTPSLPERKLMLEECERSVEAQTFEQWEHLIEIDTARNGCAQTMNLLAEQTESDWLLPLADDDLLLPGCLNSLLNHSEEGEIIYAPPLVTGNEDRWWFFQEPPAIPSCALISSDLWKQLGGYDETLTREEDRDLWVKALEAGATFVRVDAPCWIYRQHSGNKSFAGAAA